VVSQAVAATGLPALSSENRDAATRMPVDGERRTNRSQETDKAINSVNALARPDGGCAPRPISSPPDSLTA